MKTATVVLFALAAVISNYAYAGEAAPEAFVPGMGEIMGLTQMRHAKLWYAGNAGNWDLAQYELDELEEGFSDAGAYHPTVKEVVPRFVTSPLDGLGKAVKAKDKAKFVQAFDRLTDACNGCHADNGHEFIRIGRPAPGLYSNQDFSARNK